MFHAGFAVKPVVATESASYFNRSIAPTCCILFFRDARVSHSLHSPKPLITFVHFIAFRQTLVDTGWICHTSGNTSHPFIFGSYFYTLLAPDLKAHGPQGSHVASEEVLCSGGGATDGSEWTASSSSTVSGSSNVQAGGSASKQFPSTPFSPGFLSCTCD